MVRLTVWVLGLWLCAAGSAFAQSLGESSDASLQAIETARTAVSEALSKAPLGFRRILFVTRGPRGVRRLQAARRSQVSSKASR